MGPAQVPARPVAPDGSRQQAQTESGRCESLNPIPHAFSPVNTTPSTEMSLTQPGCTVAGIVSRCAQEGEVATRMPGAGIRRTKRGEKPSPRAESSSASPDHRISGPRWGYDPLMGRSTRERAQRAARPGAGSLLAEHLSPPDGFERGAEVVDARSAAAVGPDDGDDIEPAVRGAEQVVAFEEMERGQGQAPLFLGRDGLGRAPRRRVLTSTNTSVSPSRAIRSISPTRGTRYPRPSTRMPCCRRNRAAVRSPARRTSDSRTSEAGDDRPSNLGSRPWELGTLRDVRPSSD